MNKNFYPTPSTTTYYINEFLIEDLFRIDFKREVRRQPIYGYDSKHFDFVTKGKEIVTGQLVINYRYPGYLKNFILDNQYRDQDKSKALHKAGYDETEEGRRSHALHEVAAMDTLPTREDKIKYLAKLLDRAEVSVESSGFVNNVDLGPSNTVRPNEMFEILKKNFERRALVDPNALQEEDIDNKFLESPLDDEYTPFDIKVRYGHQDVPGGYVRIFQDVHLIGEEAIVSAQAGGGTDQSSSAQPIFEVYPFFARSIRTTSYNIT